MRFLQQHEGVHMEHNIIIEPTRDERLATALADLGRSLAMRPETDGGAEHEWAERAVELAVKHPDPFVRSKLAQIGSLRQVKALAKDEHVGVRAACGDNKFTIDEDLQMLLATDKEAVVVHSLLDGVTPYMSVVRLRLAFQNLASELLEVLATDTHERVAYVAQYKFAMKEERLARRKNS
jgi:hypothetical protein